MFKYMKKFFGHVLYRLIGKKPYRGTDITPKGVEYTVISREFTDKFKYWDSEKFKNIKEV